MADKDDIKRRSIWIGDELWDAAGRAANLEDRTVSSWVRRTLADKLKRAGLLTEDKPHD